MAAQVISGLVSGTKKRPHDIGLCPSFDVAGVEVVRWIEVVSGQCVYGNLGAVSWVFGYLSILSWLCAQLPQIISNYQNGSVDGLSPVFLTNWFMGDITNLLGCILTRQLPFQTLLACYYVLVDSVLMFQFFFYKILFPPRPQALIPPISSNSHSQHHNGAMTPQPHSTSAPVTIYRIKGIDRNFQRGIISVAVLLGFVSMVAGEPPPDTLDDDGDSTEFVGRVFAWICCVFYLTSRIPQILENHRRKSTQGINIALFTAALCGNMFYTAGILTNPLAHNPAERRDFLVNAFPYLLGSAGTITFDVTILMQYFRYYGQEATELDREAIKRYLTTDESWLQHRWMAFRRKLQCPFRISFHDGPYRPRTLVIEGVEPSRSEDADVRRKSSEEGDRRKVNETHALLPSVASSRSYGTQ